MIITYNKNPLCTTVELDENEKKELWYKIKISEMEELLFNAHFHLKDGKHFDLEQVRKDVDPDYYCTDEKSPLDKRCDMLLEHYVSELMTMHLGDCVCFACSCSKCLAESMVGIDTIPGLGKHSANKIDGAFGKNNERTLEEAIEYLANYDPKISNADSEAWEKLGGFEQYIPRWKAEAKVAHDWLLNYKNQYFKDSN